MGTIKKIKLLVTDFIRINPTQVYNKQIEMSSDLRAQYGEKIQRMAAEKGGNPIPERQRFMQRGSPFVHLKTATDQKLFRFLMPLSYITIAGTLGAAIAFALGKIKKAPSE